MLIKAGIGQFDLSATYGRHERDTHNFNLVSPSYGLASKTDLYAGQVSSISRSIMTVTSTSVCLPPPSPFRQVSPFARNAGEQQERRETVME